MTPSILGSKFASATSRIVPQPVATLANKLAWETIGALGRPLHRSFRHDREIPGGSEDGEWVREYQGTHYIEPKWGYVISEDGRLIDDSMRSNWNSEKPPWRMSPPPSPFEFVRNVTKGRADIVEYDSVVHLRHVWEPNYYHFHIDVLSKLHLADLVGIDRRIPIILGGYAHRRPYAQEMIGRGNYARRDWVVQDNRIIKVKRVIVVRTKRPLYERVDFHLQQCAPPLGLRENAGIFLTRPPGMSRAVANLDQIEPVLRRFGIRTVFTDGMLLEEQMRLFRSVRVLVAVHGAGIVNAIYRGDAPLDLIELRPANYNSFVYSRLAASMGWGYRLVDCPTTGDQAEAKNRQILVNPNVLATMLGSTRFQTAKAA